MRLPALTLLQGRFYLHNLGRHEQRCYGTKLQRHISHCPRGISVFKLLVRYAKQLWYRPVHSKNNRGILYRDVRVHATIQSHNPLIFQDMDVLPVGLQSYILAKVRVIVAVLARTFQFGSVAFM